MLSPLDKDRSGGLLCEEGDKRVGAKESFPSSPLHLFLSASAKKMQKSYSLVCMVSRGAGRGHYGAEKSTLRMDHV